MGQIKDNTSVSNGRFLAQLKIHLDLYKKSMIVVSIIFAVFGAINLWVVAR